MGAEKFKHSPKTRIRRNSEKTRRVDYSGLFTPLWNNYLLSLNHNNVAYQLYTGLEYAKRKVKMSPQDRPVGNRLLTWYVSDTVDTAIYCNLNG